jgi:hypothetical protein
MSDQQLEKAAREYCNKKGLDPEEIIKHGVEPDYNGYIPDICLVTPRWKLVARELHELQLKLECLSMPCE